MYEASKENYMDETVVFIFMSSRLLEYVIAILSQLLNITGCHDK